MILLSSRVEQSRSHQDRGLRFSGGRPAKASATRQDMQGVDQMLSTTQ